MQRRNFLRLTGLSAAALLFENSPALAGVPTYGLQYPSSVSLWRDGRWQPLTGRTDKWSLDSLSVTLHQTKDSTGIRIHAPGMSLEKIKLSWTQSFAPSSRMLGDAWERSYGDLSWSDTTNHAPWYLLIHDGKSTQAFGVRTGARTFCSWQASTQELALLLDLHSGGMGVELGDRILDAAEIITTKSLPNETPFHTDTRFCRMMCKNPRLPQKPVYGINDWYFAYGKNTKELIYATTAAMAEQATNNDNRPFSVIDDGWEDGEVFTRSNNKFGDMQQVTALMKKFGARPGLWTRPLLANSADPANLLITRKSDGKERYLDPTLPENLQRIASTIRLYRDWGFEMVKHDYSTFDFFGKWGVQMFPDMTTEGWRFNDRSKTNAEIILTLYQTIREAAGPMYLIGCNTVSHLSAGIFELNRIGDDTSGREWDRVVKYGVNTLGFRLPQHNTFYAADGDCVGITTQIPWNLNKQWLQLLAESGAPLFISASPAATGPEQKKAIRHAFTLAAKPQPTAQPLDWLTNPHPSKWRLNNRIVTFDWHASNTY